MWNKIGYLCILIVVFALGFFAGASRQPVRVIEVSGPSQVSIELGEPMIGNTFLLPLSTPPTEGPEEYVL